MKLLIILLLFGLDVCAQEGAKLQKNKPQKWKLDANHLLTGSLVTVAGACKGFNETLVFHFKGFHRAFTCANAQWFEPRLSWKNKYRHRDPQQGPKFPLSTTVFAFTTDQYHLNNFIGRSAMLTALVIKIGEGKKPFRYYLFDLLYYTACYQIGFSATYYPFSSLSKNH